MHFLNKIMSEWLKKFIEVTKADSSIIRTRK